MILIPYLREHPFNQACSPTKIMDGMGSGRPIVATAIPECRLYAELFDVAEDHDAFLSAVERLLANGSDDGKAGLRHAHARRNTCGRVGRRSAPGHAVEARRRGRRGSRARPADAEEVPGKPMASRLPGS